MASRPGDPSASASEEVVCSPTALADAVAELVRIPSVDPLLHGPKAAPGGEAGERAMAEHLAARFEALGAAEVVLDEAAPGRPNVYGLFPGRTDRLVVIDTHTDTVGVEDMTDPPFDGRIEGGRVWGRGALDTKATAGVLLSLLAAWQVAGTRPDPTLLVAGTVGEEQSGFPGALRFRQWAIERGLEIDQMVVAEPTGLAPIHGHKGGVGVLVTTIGHAAHSAVPERGVNAVEAMAPVLAAMRVEHDRLQTLEPTTEVGYGTLSVTMISGGTGGTVIPDRCSIVVTRRTVPGEDPDDVYDQIAEVARAASPVPVEVVTLLTSALDGKKGFAAFYQPADTRLARRLAELAGTSPTVAPYGSNALFYGGLARELVLFGPGSIDNAHQPTEHVDIADLTRTADVLDTWLTTG